MRQVDPLKLYSGLGKHFATYDEFEEAVVSVFNKHVGAFPPGYSYLNLIRWGEVKNWIRQSGDSIRIELPTAFE